MGGTRANVLGLNKNSIYRVRMARRSNTNQKALIIQPTHSSPSLFQTVKEGFSFGLGSAIAHRIVGGLFASPPGQTKERVITEYEQCLIEHRDFGDSTAMCSYLLKAKETSASHV